MAYILRKGVSALSDLVDDSAKGNILYLDTLNGSDGNSGANWDQPLKTMSKALDLVETNGKIYFVGDVREELTGSNLKFDVSIIGAGNRPHHPDSPATGYNTGASCWRPPAVPTTATPLLKVRGRGWHFENILFDCPVDAAAVYLERNALSTTSEYDASHATFKNCRFDSGLVGIENAGGCGYVEVDHCRFYRMSGSGSAGIKCTSTSVAVPLNWEIHDNIFQGNTSHILSSMSYSAIYGNIFGNASETLIVDIYDQPSAGQGEYNVITMNHLSGTYEAAGYPAGSNNEWGGNFNSLTGGVTAADPA